MLLLPIGPEERPIRHPWLTLGLVALNVAAFLALWVAEDHSGLLLRRGQLRTFLTDHPELEPPPDLAGWVEHVRGAGRTGGFRLASGADQQTLDLLSQRMRDAIDR